MKYNSVITAVTTFLATFSAAAPAFATNWVYIGHASTGEALYVDSDSIFKGQNGSNHLVAFSYSLNEEELNAMADCSKNEWYVEDFGTYSPESQATQDMLNYVCQ